MEDQQRWLEVWETDKVVLHLDLEPSIRSIFVDFLASAEETLSSVFESFDTPTEDSDRQDLAYRNVHYILGFCGVFDIQKAVHVLMYADYLIDLGRKEGKFSRGSMDYVIKLSINTAIAIFRELKSSGSCTLDISEIIEECARYINPLIDLTAQSPLDIKNPPLNTSSPDNKIKPESRHKGDYSSAPKAYPEMSTPKNEEVDFDEILTFSEGQFSLVSEFCSEAREIIQRIEIVLIELESTDEFTVVINELFRSVHTLKGNARLLSIRKIELLAHEMENLLDDLRHEKIGIDIMTIDILLEASKSLSEMTEFVSENKVITTPIAHIIKEINRIQNRSDSIEKERGKAERMPVVQQKVSVTKERDQSYAQVPEDTLRVPTSKLDEVLDTASEVFVTRIRLQSDILALTDAIGLLRSFTSSDRFLETSEAIERLQVTAERISEKYIKGYETQTMASRDASLRRELSDINESVIRILNADITLSETRLLVEKVDLIRKKLQKDVVSLEALSGRLQSGTMNFRMVPVSQLFNRFPPLLRDMARQLGKNVKLEIEGNSTELDKVLIGQLADPLVHIIRNALDHGMERPDERVALGKPETGKIKLSAYYEGSYVVIQVVDDGIGINTDRIISKAIETGSISSDRATQMTRNDIIALIFEPGFSTSSSITEVSGRGVGMDVVKTAVQQMQGSIAIESTPSIGTTIRIKIPLTLAVVGVVLIEENGYQFALPVLNVVEVISVCHNEFRTTGSSVIMNFRGRTLVVSTLSSIMSFPASSFFDEKISVVVISDGDQEIGLMVDQLLGQHDVLIKQFGRLVTKIPFLMGCTILSDSRLVSVLNVWEILSSKHYLRTKQPGEDFRDQCVSRRKHTILVVDDSAIQRNRIASSLVRAGYIAVTAEDGFDALGKVRSRRFSACCVDVFMPIVDGLEFVESLKKSPDTSGLPVFMMSGRSIDQPSDRQRLDRLGVLGFFLKPFGVDVLINALDRILVNVTD